MASPIQINNDAVRHFANGNYKESMALLQIALQQMRSRLALPRGAGENVGGSRSREFVVQSVSLRGTLSDSLEKDNCNGMTYFDRAFVITSGDEDTTAVDTYETECKTCALILYNIGVTHHMEGLLKGKEQVLDRAFRVYRMAVEFLQLQFFNNALQQPLEIDGPLFLLSMASMNNIAHIQSSFFNYGETTHCIQWLRQATAHLDSHLLKVEDYMFFFVRYYVVPTNRISTSPAA